MRARYIQDLKALSFATQVLEEYKKNRTQLKTEPEQAFKSLLKKLQAIKQALQALIASEYKPCGVQDACGTRLDRAVKDFEVQLAIMYLAKDRMPKSLARAWHKMQG